MFNFIKHLIIVLLPFLPLSQPGAPISQIVMPTPAVEINQDTATFRIPFALPNTNTPVIVQNQGAPITTPTVDTGVPSVPASNSSTAASPTDTPTPTPTPIVINIDLPTPTPGPVFNPGPTTFSAPTPAPTQAPVFKENLKVQLARGSFDTLDMKKYNTKIEFTSSWTGKNTPYAFYLKNDSGQIAGGVDKQNKDNTRGIDLQYQLCGSNYQPKVNPGVFTYLHGPTYSCFSQGIFDVYVILDPDYTVDSNGNDVLVFDQNGAPTGSSVQSLHFDTSKFSTEWPFNYQN